MALASGGGRADQDLPLAAMVTAYLDHLATERRQSPHTCSGYRRDLDRLVTWLEDQAPEIARWDQLLIEDVRRHVAFLNRSGQSGRSIARTLSAIRGFFDYLLRERQVKANPALDVRAPKSGRRLPVAADADQLGYLLGVAPDDPLEARDLAMFELF